MKLRKLKKPKRHNSPQDGLNQAKLLIQTILRRFNVNAVIILTRPNAALMHYHFRPKGYLGLQNVEGDGLQLCFRPRQDGTLDTVHGTIQELEVLAQLIGKATVQFDGLYRAVQEKLTQAHAAQADHPATPESSQLPAPTNPT